MHKREVLSSQQVNSSQDKLHSAAGNKLSQSADDSHRIIGRLFPKGSSLQCQIATLSAEEYKLIYDGLQVTNKLILYHSESLNFAASTKKGSSRKLTILQEETRKKQTRFDVWEK